MHRNRPRWNLKHLAIAVAGLALGSAAFGVGGTAVGLVLCLPAILAPGGRRFAACYWVAACYPMLILASLYATWVAAWFALGHRPRSSLDDPKDIGAIAELYELTAMMLVGSLFALLAAVVFTGWRLFQGIEAKVGPLDMCLRLGVPVALWILSFTLLSWDPFQVLDWYMD